LLKKKFLEYRDYANATITDIFTGEELKDAVILKAATMHTIYLENQGVKGFVLHDLPLEAQYAPVHGIVVADVNKDGKKDILLAGNNTWTRIKFGRYTANHGVLLLGDGKNNFTYVPQTKSGLNIKGNVRGMELINGKQVIAGINNEPAVLLKINW
jgi:enediyne biosynthesis protein E4